MYCVSLFCELGRAIYFIYSGCLITAHPAVFVSLLLTTEEMLQNQKNQEC